jgi:hypothetical protein
MISRAGSETLLVDGWVSPSKMSYEVPTQDCKLTGFIQVEGEAQGSDEIMKKFFQQIGKGPRMAHVVKLEKRDMDLKDGEDHFAVMRTGESMFESGS